MSASQEDIRENFRKLSKKYHPDRNPKSRERFEKINVGTNGASKPTRPCMTKIKSTSMTEWALKR